MNPTMINDWFEVAQCVSEFSEKMLGKLAHRRGYGDRTGWRNKSAMSLLVHLKAEVKELEDAILTGTDKEITNEAADVANMAMMVADKCKPLIKLT